MGLFRKRSYITINHTKVDLSEQSELPTVPDGKWVKCPSCDKIVYKEDLGSLKSLSAPVMLILELMRLND